MGKAKSYALRLLAKKDYFEGELREKLARKGFSQEEIDRTVNYLKEEGLIDDRKLIERYKELSLQKGKSSAYLKAKLLRKGVREVEISFEEELQSALYLLENKFRKEKNYPNVVKFLKNRGFSYGVIQEAVNKFLNGEK
ncbi:MAG: regulatory protein RecX [Aquificae bacterium]|nr:regulatory protein RecX [Aquificota bacterium]